MKNDLESNITFQITFNDKVIEISYDKSFPEFQTKTVQSLIETVLDKLSQPESKKEINNYCLFCPCGEELELTKLLYKNLCEHKYLEKDNKKNLGEKYLLIEKMDKNLFDKIEENEQPLSKEEFDKLYSEKIGNKQKIKKKKCKNNDNSNKSKKSFIMTEAFEKRVKKLFNKFDKTRKFIESGLKLFYDENKLNILLSMGIDEKKARAALRLSNDEVNNAVLIATGSEFNFEGKEFLFYANDELIDQQNFGENLEKEIKIEYPFLNEEQVNQRVKDIFAIIVTKKSINEENERLRNPFLSFSNNEDEAEDEHHNSDEEEEEI